MMGWEIWISEFPSCIFPISYDVTFTNEGIILLVRGSFFIGFSFTLLRRMFLRDRESFSIE